MLVVLCAFLLAAAHAGAVTPAEQEAKQYLDTLPSVRLYVPRAPGSGHQASSISVLRRLRQLGYDGSVEIIYQNDTERKLEPLLPGFEAKGPLVQTLAGGITAIRQDQWKQGQESPRVGLALSGGDDQGIAWPELNTDLYLQLNPRHWQSNYSITVRDDTSPNRARRYSLPMLNAMYISQELPQPGNVTPFIDEAMHGTPFAEKTELVHLLQSISGASSGFEFIPAYGLSRRNDEFRFGNYLDGLRIALAKAPSDYRPAGAVVGVLSEFGEERRFTLEERIAELHEMNGELPQIRVIGETAADVKQFLQEPPTGRSQIGIVLLGRVPRDIFDHLFLQATLPAIAEGRQTANLLHTAAVPHFATFDDDRFDPEVTGHELLVDVSEALVNTKSAGTPNDVIARGFEDFKHPASKIRAYFQEMRRRATSVHYDMVVQSLRLAGKVARSLPEPHKVLEHPALKESGESRECFLRFLDLSDSH